MKLDDPFAPPWWLTNNHLQSLFGALHSPCADLVVKWQEHALPDGDFLDLCWAGPKNRPIIILLHGLEGSISSHYMQLMIRELLKHDFCTLTMHFRGCSGRLNRKARFYHAGDTDDFAHVLNTISRQHPNTPMAAIGFSVGGNVLLKYMAENPDNVLKSGVAVSVPFDVGQSADFLLPFYQWRFLHSMKLKASKKVGQGLKFPVSMERIEKVSSFREFDRLITAPMFDFKDENHYYQKVSSKPILGEIKKSTLILHAADDPFIPAQSIPHSHEVSASTLLEISDKGGHVGFIKGGLPWRPEYWLYARIARFFRGNF